MALLDPSVCPGAGLLMQLLKRTIILLQRHEQAVWSLRALDWAPCFKGETANFNLTVQLF